MTTTAKSVSVKLTADDLDRLEAIMAEAEGATLSGLVKAAMRIGLDRIERRPQVLDRHDLDTRGGARPGAGRKPTKPKRRKGRRR